jgi:CubicO group peptidase (beta-lactamase class C family)
MANHQWRCAYATILPVLALAGGCATPNRDAYVPAVASPSKEPLNREARVARAKALEFSTEYVAPPGDPMSHHAAALARVVCSAVFISGLDADFAVANVGVIPPFDVRKDLGRPAVDAAKKTVDVATPKGVVRSARFLGSRQGCVVAAESGEPLHFAPKEPTPSSTTTARSPWPAGETLPQESLPVQIDAVKLKRAVDAAFEPAGAMTSAYVVAWRGKIIAERYAPGITPQTPLESWAMGKTVIAVLMGMLIADGTYDLWQPAPIPEWRQPGDPRRDIRIADLLRMSGGLRFRAKFDAESYPAGDYGDDFYVNTADVDVAKYVVTRPPQWPAGTVARDRSSDAVVVAYLIRRAAEARGQDFYSYAQRALFDKLGMRTLTLEPDAFGTPLAHGFVLGSGRDWARLGNLLLQDGRWNGEALVPESYVRFMRTAAPAWAADGRPRYGGFVWLNRANDWPGPQDSYALFGSGGQATWIFPTHDLVVVRMGYAKGGDESPEPLKLILEAVPQSRPVEAPFPAKP